jgi:hypothetical protein
MILLSSPLSFPLLMHTPEVSLVMEMPRSLVIIVEMEVEHGEDECCMLVTAE